MEKRNFDISIVTISVSFTIQTLWCVFALFLLSWLLIPLENMFYLLDYNTTMIIIFIFWFVTIVAGSFLLCLGIKSLLVHFDYYENLDILEFTFDQIAKLVSFIAVAIVAFNLGVDSDITPITNIPLIALVGLTSYPALSAIKLFNKYENRS